MSTICRWSRAICTLFIDLPQTFIDCWKLFAVAPALTTKMVKVSVQILHAASSHGYLKLGHKSDPAQQKVPLTTVPPLKSTSTICGKLEIA